MELPNIFKGDYRLLAIPPLILIVASLLFIPQVKLGVDFTGGTLVSLTLDKEIDGELLQQNLESEGLYADIRAYETAVGWKAEIEFPQSESLVEAEELKNEFYDKLDNASRLEVLSYQNESYAEQAETAMDEMQGITERMYGLAKLSKSDLNATTMNELESAFSDAYRQVYSNYQDSISKPIEKYVSYSSISVQTVSPVLSTHFLEKARYVVVMAAVLSTVFVFLFFRNIAASIAVMTGALSDIIISVGAMGLFGIPLTLPSFAALLMLIGYSLDTDILLTMRMLKRRGDNRDKAHDAMKTGLTMSVTAVLSFGVIFVLATLTHIPTYYEIASVALAGLIGDMFATWGINAVLLLYFIEKRGM